MATRLGLAAFTYFFGVLREPLPGSLHALAQTWMRWDGWWYYWIARDGYTTSHTAGFFPLYPALTAGVNLLVGGHHLMLADFAVAQVAALAAFAGLGLLASREGGGQESAWRTMRVAAAYPLAFFLAAPYTDGLFLACAAFALFSARAGAWRWAALAAFLAALTRPTAIALMPALLWEYGRQNGLGREEASWDWRRLWRWRTAAGGAAAVLAVPAGFAVYMGYLWSRFGDPFLYFTVQQRDWDHKFEWPWRTASTLVTHFLHSPPWTPLAAFQWIDVVPWVLFAALTVLTVRRIPFAFTLYMAALLALLVATPSLKVPDILPSNGRYLLASVPIFWLLATWTARRPWLDMLIVSAGFLLQAVFAMQFITDRWIG